MRPHGPPLTSEHGYGVKHSERERGPPGRAPIRRVSDRLVGRLKGLSPRMLAVVSVLVLMGVGAATIGAISAARTDVQNERFVFRAASGQVGVAETRDPARGRPRVDGERVRRGNRHLTGRRFDALGRIAARPSSATRSSRHRARRAGAGVAASRHSNAEMARNPLYPFGSSAPSAERAQAGPAVRHRARLLVPRPGGARTNTGVVIPPASTTARLPRRSNRPGSRAKRRTPVHRGSGKPTLGVETPVYSSGLSRPRERTRTRVHRLARRARSTPRRCSTPRSSATRTSQCSSPTRARRLDQRPGGPATRAAHRSTKPVSRRAGSVRTFGPATAPGIFDDGYATMLLLGGVRAELSFALVMLVLATERTACADARAREDPRALAPGDARRAHGLPNRALVIDRAAAAARARRARRRRRRRAVHRHRQLQGRQRQPRPRRRRPVAGHRRRAPAATCARAGHRRPARRRRVRRARRVRGAATAT